MKVRVVYNPPVRRNPWTKVEKMDEFFLQVSDRFWGVQVNRGLVRKVYKGWSGLQCSKSEKSLDQNSHPDWPKFVCGEILLIISAVWPAVLLCNSFFKEGAKIFLCISFALCTDLGGISAKLTSHSMYLYSNSLIMCWIN